MQAIMDEDPFEEWKSLFTDEIEELWYMERKELRKFAMVLHILKQEYLQIEANFQNQLEKYHQQFKSVDLLIPPMVPVNEPQTNGINSRQLENSPKLNKHGKSAYMKKRKISMSLLKLSNENKTTAGVNNEDPNTDNQELQNSPVLISSGEINVIKPFTKETPNADIVNSSLIVEDTPKKFISKKSKSNRSATLTQMFDTLSQQKRSKKSDSKEKSKRIAGNDETYFSFIDDVKSNTKTENKKMSANVVIPSTFLKDYDKFPEVKKTSPQHPHKTETVRRKADRMKLPGWSCNDCKDYYEGLNLSPEALHRKMNACSKHRNKFQPMDQTPKGYWDLTMHATQDPDDSDETYYNF